VNKSLIAYREAVCVELAVKGHTFEEIADIVGYRSRSGAWRAVRRALNRRTAQAADQYLSQTLVDLEAVQQRAWPAAMAVDVGAQRVAVRTMEQRRRLLGLARS
jgi:hypothetical protein